MNDIAARARRVVEVLSRNFPSRNGLHRANLLGAADFIEKEFLSLGWIVKSQAYETNGGTVRNLIVEQLGQARTKPCIVIGAHYDSVLGTPGADDNASGVAGLIESVRLLKNYSNQRTICFAAFAHEEPPYFLTRWMGSRQYAKLLQRDKTNVQVMFSLEMIGYAGDTFKQSYPFPFLRQLGRYPKHGNYIALVSNLRTRQITKIVLDAMQGGCNIGVESLAAPGFLPPLFLSDHAAFWKAGYPAIMVTDTAFLRNSHYHRGGDTDDTLNYDFLAEVVKGMFHAILELDKLP